MYKIILAALLGTGSFAWSASPESDVQCNHDRSVMTKADVFDLDEGQYKPDPTDPSFFCASYTIKNTSYSPCSGNITSLTLACEGKTDRWDMACSAGSCSTSDGVRTITLDKDFSNWAKYESGGHKTVLRYSGPCN